MGYPGHVNCTRELQRRGRRRTAIAARAGLGGAQLLLQHARSTRTTCSSPDEPWSRPGRLRPAAGDDRPRVRLVGVPRRHRPRQRLGDHRHPRARLLAREPLLDGHRPPRDPGGRASADQGDGVPPAHQRAHRELRRSTAATGCRTASTTRAPIAEYWACREKAVVMDLSPLRKWEVLGPDAEALIQHGGHARRAPAGGRPGRLHGGLQRDRRHDRRRHRLPARRRQLPLRRRRRVRRRVAARSWPSGSACSVWVKPSTDQLHNVAVQGPRAARS